MKRKKPYELTPDDSVVTAYGTVPVRRVQCIVSLANGVDLVCEPDQPFDVEEMIPHEG
jgi:hypothetical protein